MNLWSSRFLLVALLAVAGANLSFAKDKKADNSTDAPGEVYVHVMPQEAYVWVDDKPMTHQQHPAFAARRPQDCRLQLWI